MAILRSQLRNRAKLDNVLVDDLLQGVSEEDLRERLAERLRTTDNLKIKRSQESLIKELGLLGFSLLVNNRTIKVVGWQKRRNVLFM
jgi:hypothetical protein